MAGTARQITVCITKTRTHEKTSTTDTTLSRKHSMAMEQAWLLECLHWLEVGLPLNGTNLDMP